MYGLCLSLIITQIVPLLKVQTILSTDSILAAMYIE